MNDEMNVNDVVSYIQYLKKEKESLLLQVKDIDVTLLKIKESLIPIVKNEINTRDA